jgi:ABC-type branched-subunit amino acid transport system ATPase component
MLGDRHYVLDQGTIVFSADRAGFANAHAERERYLAVAAY